MGTRPKFGRMHSTPERLRESVRKAVSFGKWFPLDPSAATERAELERAPSPEPRAPIKLIDVRGLRRPEGSSIPYALHTRLTFLKAP
jgi:hypothetical protein